MKRGYEAPRVCVGVGRSPKRRPLAPWSHLSGRAFVFGVICGRGGPGFHHVQEKARARRCGVVLDGPPPPRSGGRCAFTRPELPPAVLVMTFPKPGEGVQSGAPNPYLLPRREARGRSRSRRKGGADAPGTGPGWSGAPRRRRGRGAHWCPRLLQF